MKKIKFTVVRLRGPGAFLLACVVGSGSPSGVAQAQHPHSAAQNAAPQIGAPAIPFELKTLDGRSISLRNYRGKPLMINFFASWCDPCREEMPLINELAARSRNNDYSVLAIAVEDSRAAVTEYAKESKLNLPIALDLNSTVRRAYRIFGPPASFFIDGQGIIRDVVIGPLTPERVSAALKNVGIVR
jgi:cytochrome c biogenesis protein CcmG/thiol:disulfide interchange protein DsbE